MPVNAEKGSPGGNEHGYQALRGKGSFFADALSEMSKAFEVAIWTLGIGSDEAKPEAVARFIIRSAQRDGNFDAATLHRMAVAEFGGSPTAPAIIDTDGPPLAVTGSVG